MTRAEIEPFTGKLVMVTLESFNSGMMVEFGILTAVDDEFIVMSSSVVLGDHSKEVIFDEEPYWLRSVLAIRPLFGLLKGDVPDRAVPIDRSVIEALLTLCLKKKP